MGTRTESSRLPTVNEGGNEILFRFCVSKFCLVLWYWLLRTSVPLVCDGGQERRNLGFSWILYCHLAGI
jgi:hypothetical protein